MFAAGVGPHPRHTRMPLWTLLQSLTKVYLDIIHADVVQVADHPQTLADWPKNIEHKQSLEEARHLDGAEETENVVCLIVTGHVRLLA